MFSLTSTIGHFLLTEGSGDYLDPFMPISPTTGLYVHGTSSCRPDDRDSGTKGGSAPVHGKGWKTKINKMWRIAQLIHIPYGKPRQKPSRIGERIPSLCSFYTYFRSVLYRPWKAWIRPFSFSSTFYGPMNEYKIPGQWLEHSPYFPLICGSEYYYISHERQF